jgi:hypothetical protein
MNMEFKQRISGNIMQVLWRLKWLILGLVVGVIVIIILKH